RRSPRPSLDDLLALGCNGIVDLLGEVAVDERTLLNGTRHLLALLPAAFDDHAVGPLIIARLQSFGELPPRRARVPAAAGATLAAAHRVVDRVHRHAAVVGPKAEPAAAAGFAPRDVLVVGVRHLADRGPAIEV